MKDEVLKIIDKLIKKGNATDKELVLIEDIVDRMNAKETKEKIKQEERTELLNKLDELISISRVDNSDIINAVEKIKLNVEAPIVNVEPPKVEVTVPEIKSPVVNIPETVVNFPSEVSILKPSWINGLINLSPITKALESIKNSIPSIVWPNSPKEPVSVRLTDGEKFYKALGGSGTTIASIPTFKNSDGEVTQGLIKKNVNTLNGEVLVNLEGHQCPGNSTIENLNSNEMFTGLSWQDTLDYGVLSINISSSHDSATDGLDIQWSNDGVTVMDHDYYTIYAGYPKTFTFGPVERYYRVVYTNGPTTTTHFHLTSLLRRCYVKPSSHRINDPIVGEDDAELVKSIVSGIRDDGIFGNSKLDNDNKLMVNSQPYLYSIAEGDISNHSTLLKFGTRTTVAANTQSIIWEGTNALYTYLTSAEQLKVSSSSAADGVGGTGILTLTLVGLDGNWNEITETVTMNGLTAVTTTASFIRIYRVYGATSGTSLTNVGAITITNNAGTNQLVYIPAGDGQTLMTIWTVPIGKVAYLTMGTCSTNSNKGMRVSLYTRLNDGGTLYPWQIKYRAYIFSGNEVFPFNIPFKIPAKTDVEVRVITPTAAGDTSCGATFELWYEDV